MIKNQNGLYTIELEDGSIRKLGIRRGDTFWGVPRNESKHLFISLNSWGISVELLEILKKDGVKTFIFREKEKQLYYSVEIEKWLKEGKILEFKKQGFETQIFMKKDSFITEKV